MSLERVEGLLGLIQRVLVGRDGRAVRTGRLVRRELGLRRLERRLRLGQLELVLLCGVARRSLSGLHLELERSEGLLGLIQRVLVGGDRRRRRRRGGSLVRRQLRLGRVHGRLELRLLELILLRGRGGLVV